jgi:hypothetical protein
MKKRMLQLPVTPGFIAAMSCRFPLPAQQPPLSVPAINENSSSDNGTISDERIT